VRAAGLAIRSSELTIHTGVSLAASFRPARGNEEGLNRGFSFTGTPELSLGTNDLAIATGYLTATSGHAAGLEAALSWRKWQAPGEIYRIGIDQINGGRRFSGWYAQLSRVLVGRSRSYDAENATWDAPPVLDASFNPAAGQWGAVEAGARFSTLDLNDRDIRGGSQRIWSLGVAWWPVQRFALQLQYQHGNGQWTGLAGRQRFQSIAMRAQLEL